MTETEKVVMDLDSIIERYSLNDAAMGENAFDQVFEMDQTFSAEPEVISEQIQNLVEASDSSSLEDQQLIAEIAAIPDKLAFKIGEVAEIVDVKQYVLRYWETEFEILKPKKSRQNQRMYSKKDIENILLIKKLLYRDKFSIEGARRALKGLKKQVKEAKQWDEVADRFGSAIEQLRDLKKEIGRIRLSLLL